MMKLSSAMNVKGIILSSTIPEMLRGTPVMILPIKNVNAPNISHVMLLVKIRLVMPVLCFNGWCLLE
jgi:hypothetical protein